MTACAVRAVFLSTIFLVVPVLVEPPELGAQAASVLASAITLAKNSAGALADFAKGINAIVCTIDLISDRTRAAQERQRLTAVSSQLTGLEIAKSRFVRHVGQYLVDPSTRPWEDLRGELTAQFGRTKAVYQALEAEADFKAIVPQAARKLIIALDEKTELLQVLQRVPKPAQPDEVDKLRQLRGVLEGELGAIEAAHEGFVKYIEARTSRKVACPQ